MRFSWAYVWIAAWIALAAVVALAGGQGALITVPAAVIGAGLIALAEEVSRPVVRLLVPPLLGGLTLLAIGVPVFYYERSEEGWSDNAWMSDALFYGGLGLIAIGLVAGAIYGTVRFVLWAVRD